MHAFSEKVINTRQYYKGDLYENYSKRDIDKNRAFQMG